ncbi:hypothetical protein HYW17_05575 [Candidatus Uhrbacteria bacterium]|nr:hypothetical protein [Candidatus Uhrbacteria bacterium]
MTQKQISQKSQGHQLKKRRARAGRGSPIKKRALKSVLNAATLGIAKEQLINPSRVSQLPQPVPAVPQDNQPLQMRPRMIHRPLAPPRISFWLGVGFGMTAVGGLLAVAWYLMRVELVEAVVVGLGR